ncbi:hypothetical protein CN899_29235 [Bacillus thuringiensis]|uniref:Internalin n=1 Tax=Bacillus thuringiensis TaxID=1428 RepID=A0A9X7BTZ1_BACTU|nr:hypothetical protein [Bacillus thuringiensis]PGH78041.1 hypothetical protein CN899_29235 [Bacillus thuringiensis]
MRNINGFFLRKDIDGETLLVSQKNLGECIDYINAFNINRLQISDMYYKLEDVKFLEQCVNITHLSLDSSYLKDVSSIYNLKNLKSLSIIDSNYVLELNKLTDLECLSLYCDKKLTGLQDLSNLKSLSLWKYAPKGRDLNELKNLRKLEILNVTQCKINSLSGLENLESLKTMKLNYLRTLTTIGHVKYTNGILRYLEIEACKNIEDFYEIQHLKSLETLNLFNCGDIPTIKFIQALNNLKHLSFVESNILDGDVSFCEGIEFVSFTDKKHYSHKNKHFNNTDM